MGTSLWKFGMILLLYVSRGEWFFRINISPDKVVICHILSNGMQ
jgi:hypothetical protein